ncbi:flagellar hook protein FlgE [uncultured Algimonas sp.]|uniref:flagellar hook protein FlgE n=1 Tax=uncultured Algimonas sp. TaxID=1547920 RepID=UPI00261A61E6|nr:flagellar hook protein FlgE [uncultured Algimonas sp.]
MTISSSLNAGVMGLNVNATRLATISDNIANSATYGYKRADVEFSSLVVNQRPAVYSAGGVRATTIRQVADPGSLISTGSATDLAINGNGMLPVTNVTGISSAPAERDFMMVPTGSFTPDAEGYMRTKSGLFLLGWELDANGEPITTGRTSQTGMVPVNLSSGQFSAERTSEVKLGVNLPGDPSVLPASNSLTLPVEYFDPLGLPEKMETVFTRNTGGDWTVTVNDFSTGASAQVATFNVTFGADGTLGTVTNGTGATYNATTGEVAINIPSGPVSMFVGRQGTSQGLTQIGSTFQTQNAAVNGSAAGELQSVEITADGSLEAIYNTGARRTLFQIPVATVNNPDGLTPTGNQAYSVSRDSGDFYLWDAGEGSSGSVVGYTLMESNTDIAAELTNLIETQRAYSSNAKIVQTVDEMLQETTNLKR